MSEQGVDSRIAVLEEWKKEHSGLSIHPGALGQLQDMRTQMYDLRLEFAADLATIRIEVRVLQSKVAMYAALGAIGGSLAINLLLRFLKI